MVSKRRPFQYYDNRRIAFYSRVSFDVAFPLLIGTFFSQYFTVHCTGQISFCFQYLHYEIQQSFAKAQILVWSRMGRKNQDPEPANKQGGIPRTPAAPTWVVKVIEGNFLSIFRNIFQRQEGMQQGFSHLRILFAYLLIRY